MGRKSQSQHRSVTRTKGRARAVALASGALLAVASALSSNALRAQSASTVRTPMLSYVCTTNTGHTITGEFPPPECKDRDVRVLNADGSLNRVIPAPLTREGRKKRDEEEAKRRQEEEAERKQSQKDRSLLEAYGSVEEIDAARDRAVLGRQGLIDRANQRIAQYQRERKRLDNEAEFYAKREMPPDLKQAFEINTALTKQQEKTRADAEHDIEQIKERFEADKKRYQQLEAMAAEAAQERERREREAEAQSQAQQ